MCYEIEHGESKEHQQAASLEQDMFRSVVNSLDEGVIASDRDGHILVFNHAAERILGKGSSHFDPGEWILLYGCFLADKVTPYPSDRFPLARAMSGEEVENDLLFVRNSARPEGLWISASARPLRDSEGIIKGGAWVFRDASENRITRAESEKFARAVEQTADSVCITSPNGVIEYVNPAFETTTGYSREEAVGQTPRILKSGKHNDAFYNDLWSRLLRGEPYQGTIINKKKNGEFYWSEQSITPMKDEDGTVTDFVSVLKDVTELREKQAREFHLSLAGEIQRRLNRVTASVQGFDIAGEVYSAVETGGDYVDFISMQDGCLGIAVGDVTGHGIGSALIMAETRAYLRAFARTESDPGVILARLNHELTADLDGKHFVTLLFARLDPWENRLVYAGAGHVPAYLLNGSGEVESIMESTGVPLGLFKGARFSASQPIKLAPENIAVFLADGVAEAKAVDETEFGYQRALDIVKEHRHATANQIVDSLFRTVRAFSENHPQEDDITAAICKVNSPHADSQDDHSLALA